MPNDCISYQNSGYFTPIIVDYLDQKPELEPLYNRFPHIENFGAQIDEKNANFSGDRALLVQALEQQYKRISISAATAKNIALLKNDSTFTVTTGHQLNLFTGPLYFVYKIISAVNLAAQLKEKHPENDFVPIYWMATEDHDFEEINYFNFKGKKFRWNRDSAGPVGRLDTKGLDDFLAVFSQELGPGTNAETIKQLFSDAYLNHNNLADATRFLANSLFAAYGLVIIDADDKDLKRQFIRYIKDDLLKNTSHKKVSETMEMMAAYDIQVNPREINLFYMEDGLRERIIFENGQFIINNTRLQFSESELLALLDKHPERFSPNVIMRPLYQEVILPNLCYIGGGGEIAYWLELKNFFNAVDVTFPVLLVRNSVLLATEKQSKKADKLGLYWKDLFLKPQELASGQIRKRSEFELDFSVQKDFLRQQFDKLYDIAENTDKSFSGAVKAQEAKQIKGLENLEKRLLKAEKRKHAELLERMTDLQLELFPNGGLQERFSNFSEFWLDNGDRLIPKIAAALKPLDNRFDVIVL
jgi:bacillithiol biosynthesis cysteine-adding enzyme BshC